MGASKTHFRTFGAVINAPKESPSYTPILRGYNQTLSKSVDFGFFASIIHDKDTLDNGEPKREHLHFVFELSEPKTPNQALTLLVKILGIEKEQISIEGSNSLLLLTQYLTHQNHPEKSPYSIEQISTNNKEKLEELLGSKYQSEDDRIKEAIYSSSTIIELIDKTSISIANKYQSIFRQVLREKNSDLESTYARLREAEGEAQRLYYQLYKIVGLVRKNALEEDDLNEAIATLETLDYLRPKK